MQKSVRTFAAMAVLTLTVSLYAEQTGTNPHPKTKITVPTTTLEKLVFAAELYFSF